MTSDFTDTFVLSFLGDLDWNVPISSFIFFIYVKIIRSLLDQCCIIYQKSQGQLCLLWRIKKTIFSIGILSPYQWSTNKCIFQSFEGSHLEAFSKPCFINQTIKRKGYMLYAITACRIIPSFFLLFKWEVIHGGSKRLIFFNFSFFDLFF